METIKPSKNKYVSLTTSKQNTPIRNKSFDEAVRSYLQAVANLFGQVEDVYVATRLIYEMCYLTPKYANDLANQIRSTTRNNELITFKQPALRNAKGC